MLPSLRKREKPRKALQRPGLVSQGASSRGIDWADRGDSVSAAETNESLEAKSAAGARQHFKLQRQLVNRQEKQRATIVSEATASFNEIVRMERSSRESIRFFTEMRESAVARSARDRALESTWSSWVLSHHLEKLLADEEECRRAIRKVEDNVWRTALHVFKVEGTPLYWRLKLTHLIEAESVRRDFVYSQELEAAFQMSIPSYIPIPITARETSTQKVDFMCDERCPFFAAESCPFFPPAVLHRVRQQLEAPRRNNPASSRPASPNSNATRGVLVAPSRPPSGQPRGGAVARRITSANTVSTAGGCLDGGTQLALHAALKKPHYKSSACQLLTQGKRSATDLIV